jgi:hypothetical protein
VDKRGSALFADGGRLGRHRETHPFQVLGPVGSDATDRAVFMPNCITFEKGVPRPCPAHLEERRFEESACDEDQ